MAVRIGSARIDERGKVSGGKVGDQTGKEVSTQNWYHHSKRWVVIRAKDPVQREKIAKAMEMACANNKIGYDQTNRYALFNAVKTKGYDPSKCTEKVETDCSALVRVCCCYAGIIVGDFNTGMQATVLGNSGKFDITKDIKYTQSSDYLLRGDILVTESKGHTVVVLDNGAKADPKKPKFTVGTISSGSSSNETAAKPTLRKGSKGAEVKVLQKNLNKVMKAGLSVDSSYGSKTETAVRAFQSKYKLTVDGVYGPKTYEKMKSLL